jgi:hypothetical protein
MQLDSIRYCKKKKKKKKKSIFGCKIEDYNLTKKNTFNISNCIKIKRSSQTKFYMQGLGFRVLGFLGFRV